MKLINAFWVPDTEQQGIFDILNEWNQKGPSIVNALRHRRVAVQAGGYVGVFPQSLSKYFNEVVTFEPVPENWECLVKNTENVSNISRHNCALGNKQESVKIKVAKPGNCGAIQLEACKDGEIQVSTLDSFELNNVDLLWLDVEGFEVKALLGARATIQKTKPVIVLENNGLIHEFPSDKEGSQDFRNWMKEEFNYTHVARLMRDDVFVHSDVI